MGRYGEIQGVYSEQLVPLMGGGLGFGFGFGLGLGLG